MTYDSEGWSIIAPVTSGADETDIVYVDYENGNDATGVVYQASSSQVSNPWLPNNILPFQTPAAAIDAHLVSHGTYGVRRSFWIMLKRGTVFPESIELKSNIFGGFVLCGAAEDKRVVVDAYGPVADPRPKFLKSTGIVCNILGDTNSRDNLFFRSIHFHSAYRDPDSSYYSYSTSPGALDTCVAFSTYYSGENWHFEDILFECQSGAVQIQGEPGVTESVTFHRCNCKKIYRIGGDSSGFYTYNLRNAVFSQCVHHMVGQLRSDDRAEGHFRNQGYYISGMLNDFIHFKECMSNQISHAAFQLRGGEEMKATKCVAMRSAFGITLGHKQSNYNYFFADTYTPSQTPRYFSGEISDCLIMKPSDFFRPSGSLDNKRGTALGCGRFHTALIKNNIMAQPYNSTGNNFAMQFVEVYETWNGTLGNIDIEDNIVYNWSATTPSSYTISLGDATQPKLINGSPQTVDDPPTSNIVFRRNKFIEPNMTSGYLIHIASSSIGDPDFIVQNTFYRPDGINAQNIYGGTTLGALTFNSYKNTYEPNVFFQDQSFIDPNRDDLTYMTSLGLESTDTSFWDRAIENRRGNWDARFTAVPLLNHVRSGFGMSSLLSEFDQTTVVTPPATNPKPSINDLVIIMNNKLNNNGCWSGFNNLHRYWKFLSENSLVGNFYTPEDVPDEPNPSDNPNLNC